MSTDRGSRTGAEWTTFAVSLLIVVATMAFIAVEGLRQDRPAEPVAEVSGPIEERGGRFHVPVTVRNAGDETAESTQVVATLTLDGTEQQSDQTIDFLSGGDREDLVFVFDDDPSKGELAVSVTGFTVP